MLVMFIALLNVLVIASIFAIDCCIWPRSFPEGDAGPLDRLLMAS